MAWWEKEPLRIVEICNAMDFHGTSLAEVANGVRSLGANVQHFHCMEMAGGLDDRRLFFETSVSKKRNPDLLKEYLPLARQAGIRVIVYFNVHWYTRDFGREHPDWMQIREDGTPVDDVYTTGTSFCVNAPYRDWVFHMVRDLCRYEIGGIFFDGPIFFANTCYCESCKKLFQERTGEELPPKSNRDHPLWREMITFQADSIARFLADSNILIKEANPEILLYMNGNSNWTYWPTGRDNHRIIDQTDILGAEGGFIYGDLNRVPVYKPGIAAKLLAGQSRGKPTVVFDCAGHKSWSWYLLPKTEISLLLAETLASGGNCWLAVFPDDLNQPELEVVSSYNSFIKKNPEPFCGTKSLAKVALLWPSHAAEFYRGSSIPLTDFTKEIKAEGVGDINQEFEGFYEGLARAQQPFDVIDEANLGDLSQYRLIILPNASCLSPGDVEALKRFVAEGGNVVASFETSVYDECGQKQDDFQLSELFGVEFSGNTFGPMSWDYLSPAPAAESPVLSNITKKFLPAPTYGINVESTTGRVLVYYCGRLRGCYDHTPEISNQPFLVMNQCGKGKAFYLAGTFGASLLTYRFPEYLTLVKNVAGELSPPQVVVKDAPWVEVSLRQKESKVFLHLINHTSGLKRPLTHLHPLTNLQIELHDMKVSEARALRIRRKLRLHESESGVTITLPRLEDFEVIELLTG